MNIQLDKSLGKIWMQVKQQLKFDLDEVENFSKAAVRAKDFDDIPQSYRNLLLEVEASLKEQLA